MVLIWTLRYSWLALDVISIQLTKDLSLLQAVHQNGFIKQQYKLMCKILYKRTKNLKKTKNIQQITWQNTEKNGRQN